MGIYKVIHVKVPKALKNIKKTIFFFKKKTKKRAYKKKHTIKRKPKKRIIKKNKNIIKYIFIIIFALLVFVKCSLQSSQQDENTKIETNFFIKESIPY